MKLIIINPIAIGYPNLQSNSGIVLKFIPYIPAISVGKEIHTVIIVNVLNMLFCSKSILLFIFSFKSSSLSKLN